MDMQGWTIEYPEPDNYHCPSCNGDGQWEVCRSCGYKHIPVDTPNPVLIYQNGFKHEITPFWSIPEYRTTLECLIAQAKLELADSLVKGKEYDQAIKHLTDIIESEDLIKEYIVTNAYFERAQVYRRYIEADKERNDKIYFLADIHVWKHRNSLEHEKQEKWRKENLNCYQ